MSDDKIVSIDGGKIENDPPLFEYLPKDITYGVIIYEHPTEGGLRVAFGGMDLLEANANLDFAKEAILVQARGLVDGEG